MILDVCAEPNVLKTFRIIKIVINFIKIIVPIILIVSASMTFAKAVSSGENKKALGSFIRKMVAAVAIFLVPTFVGIILNLVNPDNEYYQCFENATPEKIQAAYKEQAELALINAKTTLVEGTYAAAKSIVDSMEDGPDKEALQKELNQVKQDVIKANQERMEKLREQSSPRGGGTGISKTGKYSKVEIIDMSEETVKAMSKQECMEFVASAAQIVYSEVGGVLPSITVAQAVLESGYCKHFIPGTHNLYGLRGYPGNKPKVYNSAGQYLRGFDNFYEATYYHATYFPNYPKSYTTFLQLCDQKRPIDAAPYLRAYAGGSASYGSTIIQLINQYNLTQYD